MSENIQILNQIRENYEELNNRDTFSLDKYKIPVLIVWFHRIAVDTENVVAAAKLIAVIEIHRFSKALKFCGISITGSE